MVAPKWRIKMFIYSLVQLKIGYLFSRKHFMNFQSKFINPLWRFKMINENVFIYSPIRHSAFHELQICCENLQETWESTLTPEMDYLCHTRPEVHFFAIFPIFLCQFYAFFKIVQAWIDRKFCDEQLLFTKPFSRNHIFGDKT